jgi:CheY-like chemotaxis protein
MWVESEPGKGSVFHFSVRLGIGKERGRVRAGRQMDIEGLRVLVVDDNATNRRILGQMLSNWRMKPRVVSSGEEALAALAAARRSGRGFALAVVDAHMPEMDGFTLADTIRQTPDLAGTTVIMLTSAGQRGDAARCREVGIAAYLTKPVKQSELWDAIVVTLSRPSEPARPAALVTRHSLRENRQRLHILLAEDNEVNQRVAVRMLEKRGHRVVTVRNGQEALRALEAEHFDLVLMDVQMPEVDGFEATRLLREQEQATGAHMPIIAMTAHAMAGDRERCLAAGMDGYVSKPVRPRELFAAIESLALVSRESEAAADEEEAGAEVIDLASLLDRVEGDKELLREIILEYFKCRPQMLSDIERALARREPGSLERAAHALKGTVGTLGAKPALEAAQRLEEIARGGDLGPAEQAFGVLRQELDRLQKALASLGSDGEGPLGPPSGGRGGGLRRAEA